MVSAATSRASSHTLSFPHSTRFLKPASLPLSLRSAFPSGLSTSELRVSHTTKEPLSSRSRNHKFCVKATSGSDTPSKSSGDGSTGPVAPESPSGQLLVQLLKSHPHLFPAAVDQELEKLAADRDATDENTNSSLKGNELTLYKRISEVRESERRKAIQEVIYSLIVQKFVIAGSPLLPKVPFIELDPNLFPFALKNASSNVRQLESVHSAEALEMVREHLAMILGQPGSIPSSMAEDRVIINTSKLRMGQVYAASIMYGYFLRRVDQRFQLEKTMRALTGDVPVAEAFQPEFSLPSDADNGAVSSNKAMSGPPLDEGKEGGKMSKLRAYVSSFDSETLQRTSQLRSRESLGVIESQTEALFGKPQLMIAKDGSVELPKDDSSQLTLSTLRRLILEAIAFGSFLWDVESYVDSHYKIVS